MSSLNVEMARQVWLSVMPKGCNKHVLQCFIQHMNDVTGLSWPSVQRVALMCGMSERTVQCHIRKLQAAGLLRPRLRTGRTTHYTIHIDALVPLVFPAATTVVLDASDADADAEQAVDNSANPAAAVDNPAPALQESAPDLHVFAPEPAKNDTKPVEICTLTKDLTPKNIPGTAAPASPATVMMIDGVNPQVLADFAAVRKSKRKGAVTSTLIEEICGQASIAGLTLEQALRTCVTRSWARLDAQWLVKAAPAGASAAPTVTVPGPAPWVPPVSTPAAPEVRAAALAKAAQIKATPLPSPALPAMPVGASDITIAADAPPHVIKAAEVVSKYRAGQHVNRFTLESACQTLKISPFGLRTRVSVSAPASAPAPVSVSTPVSASVH